MMRAMAILALLALASCGADGEPMRPGAHGEVSVGTNGVNATGGVFTTNGTITIGVNV